MLRRIILCLSAVTILGLSPLLAGEGFLGPDDYFDPGQRAWEGLIAIRNVHVVSGSPDQPKIQRRQTVLIRDGIIEAIDKKRRVEIPPEATIIEGQRRFLIPGLIDSHVHIWMGDGRFADFDEHDLWTLFLANGITTVFEMVGADSSNRPRTILFDWREDLDEGRTVGPRLFIASPRFRDEYQGTFQEIDTAVKEYAELGYDVIKVHAPNSLPNYLRLFEQADRYGIRPVGHPPYKSPDVEIDTVVEHQTMVSHSHLLLLQHSDQQTYAVPENQKREIAEKMAAAGTLLQPTPATSGIYVWHLQDAYWNRVSEADWLRYFPASVRQSWVESNDLRTNPNINLSWTEPFWQNHISMTRKAHAAGVPLLASSDSGGLDMTPYGFFFHEELRSLRDDMKLKVSEILEAATRNNAIYLGLEEELGTIEVGKWADLVLVGRNPLKKVANLGRIDGVMTRGKWIPRAQLDAALEDLATRMDKASPTDKLGPIALERPHLDCTPIPGSGLDLGGSAGGGG